MSRPDAPAVPAARRTPVRRLAGLLLTLLVVALVLLALAVAVVPAAVGGRVYTVLSGSMVPTLPVGAAVAVRPVDPAEVAVGDVVSFTDREPGSADRTVTHRVVDVEPGPVFRTRGDANAADDPHPVAPEALLGRYWYDVPLVGGLADRLRSGPGLLVAGGVVLLPAAGALLLPRRREG